MIYKIKGLRFTEEGTDEMEIIESQIFPTKEEAFAYIKENLSLHTYNDFIDTLVLTVDGVHYHYVEVEPVPEIL
jgi:hypothetical protein